MLPSSSILLHRTENSDFYFYRSARFDTNHFLRDIKIKPYNNTLPFISGKSHVALCPTSVPFFITLLYRVWDQSFSPITIQAFLHQSRAWKKYRLERAQKPISTAVHEECNAAAERGFRAKAGRGCGAFPK